MYRMLLPPQINVPMEQHPRARRRRRWRVRPEERRAREEVAVVAASIDLGRPVKWIEDRLEHLASGGQAREEMADIEAAVTADGVLLGLRMDAKLNLGAYACDPFPGAIYVGCPQRLVPGPHQDRGHRRARTPPSSATRRRTSRTAGRGRRATSCASACST